MNSEQKNAIVISIRSEWCDLIKDGRTTLELRKSRPKQEPPFRCYIYESGEYVPAYMVESKYAGCYQPGSVIGEFTCDYILRHCEKENIDIAESESCMKREKILKYAKRGEVYGWHVRDLKIYQKPKRLKEATGLKHAPQSWCYAAERKPDNG